jgi:hypothetical protein
MRSWFALVLLLGVSCSVRADESVPRKPGDAAPLVIVVDEKGAPAKLTIPKELVATMRAALDDANGNSFASATPTVAAGLSLSLALAFGGVWLVRHRAGQGAKNIALLLGGLALFTVAGANVLANFGPAKRPPPASELVVVATVDKEGAPITLTITKDKLTKAIEAARKPEPK